MNPTNEIKKDPAIQGAHILRSYLAASEIPFESKPGVNRLNIITKSGEKISVVVGEGTAAVAVDPDAISSFEIGTALEAFWAVTEAAGYGKPLPVNRGETTGTRVNYNDNYEDVYLRHSIFRRSPNASAEQLQPFMRTIKSCARKAMYRWRTVFVAMGFAEQDLVSVGMVYTTSFLHNYATDADQTNNIRLLTEFLNQRFGEMAKITHKKALNSTCLPQQVRHETSHIEEGESSFIDAFVESEDPQPDEEYEEDSFTLTFPDGSVKTLLVKNDGMLGVDFVIDNRVLTKFERDELLEQIRVGTVQKQLIRVEEPVVEQPDIKQRRAAAMAEIQKRLREMDEETRTVTLSYAALSRDYSPDARRVARRLADELVCPKCETKVASGKICLKCGVEARPLFGIDYVAFRDKLAATGHSMAEAMTAPIPESEVRARALKPVLPEEMKIAESVEKSTEVSAEPVVIEGAKELKAKYEAMSKAMRDEYIAKQPAIKHCPKCKQDLPKEAFGVRVAKNKVTGVPFRPAMQPYCKPCRRPSKAS